MRPVFDQIKYFAEHDPSREASVGSDARCDYQSLNERIQVTMDALSAVWHEQAWSSRSKLIDLGGRGSRCQRTGYYRDSHPAFFQ